MCVFMRVHKCVCVCVCEGGGVLFYACHVPFPVCMCVVPLKPGWFVVYVYTVMVISVGTPEMFLPEKYFSYKCYVIHMFISFVCIGTTQKTDDM